LRDRTIGQVGPHLVGQAFDLVHGRLTLRRAGEPLAEYRTGDQRKWPVVIARHQVDRPAQQCPLHYGALRERGGQLVAVELAHARPQADIHRRRVLRLNATHLFQDARDRQAERLEQPLPGQQSAVELALGDHGTILPGGSDNTPTGIQTVFTLSHCPQSQLGCGYLD
jgi:hypothetical protein